MTIEIDGDVTRELARAAAIEWLETDGLGGAAGSTIAGVNRRRDHALLTVAAEPEGASAILAKIDESLLVGDRQIGLGCNQFPGAISPRGFQHLAGFRHDLFPVWEYAVAGVRLRKTVAAVHGETTLVMLYEVLAAPPAALLLELRPFAGLRPPHGLCKAAAATTPALAFHEDTLRLNFSAGRDLLLFVRAPQAYPMLIPDWWHRFELEGERQRGVDYEEDLWTPGVFRARLTAGSRLGVILAAEDPAGREPFELADHERIRREKLLEPFHIKDEITRTFGLAADQFVVRRGAAGPLLLAGYPDGVDSTADALIALPGLLLVTGRHAEARRVLATIAGAARDGVLPDRLSVEPAAASLDTSLWLFPAAQRYLQASGDKAFVAGTLLPVLRQIVARHEIGTPAGLHAAADGLLSAPAESARPGKAVEINALWHNALATLAELESRCGDTAQGTALAQRARRVAKRFGELFFRSGEGCLFDSVQGEHRDPTVRAHHVLAVGLPYAALSKTRALRLLETIEERLHTPNGLRDRAVEEPEAGDGSVAAGVASATGAAAAAAAAQAGGSPALAWPWLLGPFLSSLARYQGATGRRQALELLVGLDPQLSAGCVGTLPEAVTADAPYSSRGRIAQAISVAEMLRAYVEDLAPAKAPPPAANLRATSGRRPAGTGKPAKPAPSRRPRRTRPSPPAEPAR